MRRRRPVLVPGGMRMVTVDSSRVGTWTWAPSAASENVTGTFSVRFLPSRPNNRCGFTWTRTYRSPGSLPAPWPGAPRPESLMRCPSAIPAGMRALTSRRRCSTPRPPHAEHGSSMRLPRPAHAVQGRLKENSPWFSSLTPVPEQVGQGRGLAGGSTPMPPQVRQRASPTTGTVVVVPDTASAKSRYTSVSRSAPRGAGPPRRCRRPKRSPNRFPRSPVCSKLTLNPPAGPGPPGPNAPATGPSRRTSS